MALIGADRVAALPTIPVPAVLPEVRPRADAPATPRAEDPRGVNPN